MRQWLWINFQNIFYENIFKQKTSYILRITQDIILEISCKMLCGLIFTEVIESKINKNIDLFPPPLLLFLVQFVQSDPLCPK
jgi:hypothetical protein